MHVTSEACEHRLSKLLTNLAWAAKTGSSLEMNALEDIEGLSECIGRAIQEHLAKSNVIGAWPQIDNLNHPILRFEAFIEDAGALSSAASQSKKVASVRVALPFRGRMVQEDV
jgi:hypothetical protein